MFFRMTTVITLVGGTMFLMWLGEQITARGVGNGISLIIFAGIVANLPRSLASTLELGRTGALSPGFIVALLVLAVGGHHLHRVHGARAATHRRPVSEAPAGQQDVRRRELAHAAQAQHVGRHPADLRQLAAAAADHAGQLLGERRAGLAWPTSPPIWAAASRCIWLLYVALIVFFAFFYTAVVFNPTETADNLRKYGGFVPGIRPGKNTAEYLDYVLTRLTVVGAIYLTAVCDHAGDPDLGLRGAVLFRRHQPADRGHRHMDTVAQIQSHLHRASV